MVFYMPARAEQQRKDPAEMTPREIVAELDRWIVGQDKAKRAVAIALRNRIRRQRLPKEMAEEVIPKNILMIGPTGVGKTEIARRLAKLAGSPFLKIEASKFTEVGYVGRDVESMVRDLTDIAVEMVRQETREKISGKAEALVEDRLLFLLLPPAPRGFSPSGGTPHVPGAERAATPGTGEAPGDSMARLRDRLRQELRDGKLEDREVEIEVHSSASFPAFQIFSNQGLEELGVNLKDMAPGLFGGRPKRRKVRVSEAREHLRREEEDRLLDQDAIAKEAIGRVENAGILFVDELDKVAGRERSGTADVSREGVQRDMLPIIEGTIVNTKYGMVRTDHVLFVAAGAFHVSKPSDLIPELQGRFPIRVELDALGEEEFVRILKEPHSSLVRQYTALLGTEDVSLEFTEDAIGEIARFAVKVNEATENIGARRLHTVMERLLETISFEAPERAGEHVTIDVPAVREALADLVGDQDLSRYVL